MLVFGAIDFAAAEIIAVRWGGGGGRLARLDGRIHHEEGLS